MLAIARYNHIVFAGDLHLRNTTPASRVDDFRAAQETKLDAILEIAAGPPLSALIFTGDLFDRPDPPYGLVTRYCRKFMDHPGAIFTIPGNHDVYGASLETLDRSALGVLAAADVVSLLRPDLPHVLDTAAGKIYCYGSSYMEPRPPLAPSLLRNDRSLLVTHDMVLADRLYREPDEFVTTDEFLRKHPGWNMIVCGHYHYRFLEQHGSCRILNPGAVVRIKASPGDMDLVPSVIVWDLQRDTLTPRVLPHAPASDVFRQGERTAAANAESEQRFAELMRELQARGGDAVQIADVVRTVLDSGNYAPEVREIVESRLIELQAQETGLGAT